MDRMTADILNSSFLFRGLKESDILKICEYGQFDSFKTGDVIINEGQDKACLCLLLEGSVDVVLPKVGQGFERIDHVDLSRKNQGDCFGEYSFLDGKPASASVVAVKACRVFVVQRDIFMKHLDNDDFIAKKIYYNLSRVFVDKMREIVSDSETFILV